MDGWRNAGTLARLRITRTAPPRRPVDSLETRRTRSARRTPRDRRGRLGRFPRARPADSGPRGAVDHGGLGWDAAVHEAGERADRPAARGHPEDGHRRCGCAAPGCHSPRPTPVDAARALHARILGIRGVHRVSARVRTRPGSDVGDARRPDPGHAAGVHEPVRHVARAPARLGIVGRRVCDGASRRVGRHRDPHGWRDRGLDASGRRHRARVVGCVLARLRGRRSAHSGRLSQPLDHAVGRWRRGCGAAAAAGVAAGARWVCRRLTGTAWGSILVLAVLTSIVGYVLWYWALGAGGISRIAGIQFTQPLFGLLLAAVFLGERPGPTVIVAGTAILFGAWMVQRAGTPARV